MAKEITGEELLEILNRMEYFLDELEKDSFIQENRVKLYDFLLKHCEKGEPFSVSHYDYEYEEARKKYLKVIAQLYNIKNKPLFRLNAFDDDNKYDQVIIDIFEKIFEKTEQKKVQKNQPIILSMNQITKVDLDKLDIIKKTARKIATRAKPDRIISDSASQKPSLASSEMDTFSEKSETPKSSVIATPLLSQSETSLIDKSQSVIHKIFDVKPGFFVQSYPVPAICEALKYVYSVYPDDGPHKQKIHNLWQALEKEHNLESACKMIEKARNGIGYGRFNAALKRIQIAISKNEEIDLHKVKAGMDKHGPDHYLLTRMFQ